MAITINSRPLEYDTKAIYDASSNVAEDASHINVRVESSLMIGAVAVAKKVFPLGVTVHDYTEILRSLVKNTTPDPLADTAGINIKGAGKTGSNLISSWSNYGSAFSTFSTTGNVITNAATATAVQATALSNTMSLTKGKIYVLVCTGGTVSGAGNSVSIAEGPSGVGMSAIKTTEPIVYGSTEWKVYLQPRATGNISVAVTKTNVIGAISGTFEMYELNPCDWFAFYYLTLTEKWEDASGVTQTGASTTDDYLRIFLDIESLTGAQVNADWMLNAGSKKFLLNDGADNTNGTKRYTGTGWERAVKVFRNKPGATVCSHFAFFVSGRYCVNLRYVNAQYDEAGTLQHTNTNAYALVYQPVNLLEFDQTVASYSGTWFYRTEVYLQRTGNVDVSEKLQVILDSRYFQDLTVLVWRNDKGGYSTCGFLNNRISKRKVERTQMMDSTNLKKTLRSIIVNTNTVEKMMAASQQELAYLADALSSKYVFWHYALASFKPCNVVSDTLPIYLPDMTMPQLEFEYIP